MLKNNQRGDTLIEVLFAIAAFAAVIVGSLSVMNQGASIAQRSLEITMVRQQIDAQAETLRLLNSSYIAARQSGSTQFSSDTLAYQWDTLKKYVSGNTTFSQFSKLKCPDSSSLPNNSFVINTKTAKFLRLRSDVLYNAADTFSQIQYDGVSNGITKVSGIWVEAVSKSFSSDQYQKNAGYTDFSIRACWDSPGQSTPVTLGTIVRLYEPV